MMDHNDARVHLSTFIWCIIVLFQAGMIKMEQEEFFIEPMETDDEVREEGEGGRTHIVYRSSAIKKRPVSSAAADFHSRGQSVAPFLPSFSFPSARCFS